MTAPLPPFLRLEETSHLNLRPSLSVARPGISLATLLPIERDLVLLSELSHPARHVSAGAFSDVTRSTVQASLLTTRRAN